MKSAISNKNDGSNNHPRKSDREMKNFLFYGMVRKFKKLQKEKYKGKGAEV